jgi:hypothetical protein
MFAMPLALAFLEMLFANVTAEVRSGTEYWGTVLTCLCDGFSGIQAEAYRACDTAEP